MRISDWSSDVCSSDLGNAASLAKPGRTRMNRPVVLTNARIVDPSRKLDEVGTIIVGEDGRILAAGADARNQRSAERRVGKSVSVRVDLGGRRIVKKKKKNTRRTR